MFVHKYFLQLEIKSDENFECKNLIIQVAVYVCVYVQKLNFEQVRSSILSSWSNFNLWY